MAIKAFIRCTHFLARRHIPHTLWETQWCAEFPEEEFTSCSFRTLPLPFGIKHVYITLTTLWKIFHYSPKRAESLKAVQQVLDLLELKVVKPSDTRWLSHERCVKAVKASYSAIVNTLISTYQADLFHKTLYCLLVSLIQRKCQLPTLPTCMHMGRTRWI